MVAQYAAHTRTQRRQSEEAAKWDFKFYINEAVKFDIHRGV